MTPAWLLLLFLASFDKFPAAEKFSGKPAAPVIRTRFQRLYRTMIRDAAAKGPNFAGHFTIAQWGCGAGCVSIAIVDEKTGHVWDGPFKALSMKATDSQEPLEFRLDSRLLIAHGCPEEKNCADYYYEWTGTGFKLLRTTGRE